MKNKKLACYKSPFLFTKIRRKKTCTKSEFYLPDDCWEYVFSFTDHNRDFNSLSLVSKQFLFITNRLLFSLKISHPHLCFLCHIFHRFSNLNSLDLSFDFDYRDLNADIALALRELPTLKTLSIFRINLKYENYVTSLFIDSLVSLKSLISIIFRRSVLTNDLLYSIARNALPLKRFVIKWCTGYTYEGLYCLLSKCNSIQHLGLHDENFLHNDHVSELSLLLPHLVSIDLSRCSKLTVSALLSLIRNCHSLVKITMKEIYFRNFDSFNDFHVNYQLKSLCLAGNSLINDENIIMLVSISPNLQLLDLSRCHGIRLPEMNFVLPRLEVLKLSYTSVDDKALYEISKSCHGLLQLLLTCCDHVTQKGIISVVENCTRLRKIDLRYCNKVKADVVVSEVLSRSSLKKRKLFSRNDCIIFY